MRGQSLTRRWIIGLGAIGFCGTLVHAETYHWSSGINGNWTDAAKWTPSGVPGAISPLGSPPTPNSDVAIFDAVGAKYTVTSDARNVHELQLNSPNLWLNNQPGNGLRTDRLAYKTSGPSVVTLNHNGQVEIQSGGQAPGGTVYVYSKGSASFLTNEVPATMAFSLGSGAETANTPVVLTLPNGPLNTAGVPATGARVLSYEGSSLTINASNGLPAGIDVGGGALHVPAAAGLLFQGPALADPNYIAGSLYLGGYARFMVNTRIEQGVFLQGGNMPIDPGKTINTPTQHWGKAGDGPLTRTGNIGGASGVVTLTQPAQPAELEYGIGSFNGTLNGGLHVHSAATLEFGGTLNGDLHLDSAAALTPYQFSSQDPRINGTVTANANSVIEVRATAFTPTRVIADQFVGSTTLRLVGNNGQFPEPGVYHGVLEMINGDLPPGFVTAIQFDPRWLGLTASTQIDPSDAGVLNLILTGTPGDVNVDGFVNFDDLLSLASNYGRTNTGWAQGNFDNDGVTGFSDLLALAQRYGQHPLNADGLPADFVADWSLAQSMVPEPTTALGVASSVLLVRRRVRRVAV